MTFSFQLNNPNILKIKVMEAYSAATKAHESIFNDRLDKVISIGYLNLASSYNNSAYAVYISQYERLGCDELDGLFFELNTFVEEGMQCYRTNHSHQWTDIHFQRLTQKYEAIKTVLGIVS